MTADDEVTRTLAAAAAIVRGMVQAQATGNYRASLESMVLELHLDDDPLAIVSGLGQYGAAAVMLIAAVTGTQVEGVLDLIENELTRGADEQR